MSRKTITALTALAATAVLAPAAAIAQSDAGTTVDSVELKGVYSYPESYADGKPLIATVFRTEEALPRRFDGMIRAGASLDGLTSSVGSVKGKHGKSKHCYVILTRVVDGKIAAKKTSAKVGSKHTFKVTARGTSGEDVSDQQSNLTITKKKTGDRSGKRLGC